MPPVMKFQLFFGAGSGNGWTEVHYHNSTSDPPDLRAWLNAFFTNVGGPRALLLGDDCAVGGARVSFPRVGAVASYGIRSKIAGNLAQSSAEPTLSIAMNMKDATFTKSKVTHLRGFWDSVEFDGAYHPDAAPGWNDAFVAYKDALIQGGYGWLSKDPASSGAGEVLSYTQDADGFVTFLLNPILPNVLTGLIDKTISVRFSKINNSKSPLNKPLLVSVDSATTLRTIYPVGCGPFVAKGRYNYRATAFTGYASTGTIELGRRPMGKPLGQLPGRRRVQAKY